PGSRAVGPSGLRPADAPPARVAPGGPAGPARRDARTAAGRTPTRNERPDQGALDLRFGRCRARRLLAGGAALPAGALEHLLVLLLAHALAALLDECAHEGRHTTGRPARPPSWEAATGGRRAGYGGATGRG